MADSILNLPQGNRNRQTINPDSLAKLKGMLSPSNMTSTGDSYLDKRRNQITTGEDDLAPSELEQMEVQAGLGDRGLGVSRDMIRDSGIQALKQRLGMITTQENAKAAGDIATENIKGQYSVRAAEAAARAAEARQQSNQDAIAQRTQMQIDATRNNQQAGFGHADATREDNQAFKSGEMNSTALGAIARERQHLADEVAKGQPGALGKLFGRTNPREAEMSTFDNALKLAQQISQQYPDASAEQGAAQFGENGLTPDELGQVQKFLLMLRGH